LNQLLESSLSISRKPLCPPNCVMAGSKDQPPVQGSTSLVT